MSKIDTISFSGDILFREMGLIDNYRRLPDGQLCQLGDHLALTVFGIIDWVPAFSCTEHYMIKTGERVLMMAAPPGNFVIEREGYGEPGTSSEQTRYSVSVLNYSLVEVLHRTMVADNFAMSAQLMTLLSYIIVTGMDVDTAVALVCI